MDNYKERDLLNKIMPIIEEHIIRNEQIYYVEDEFEYVAEALILYAKQHNLVESTLALIDNGHSEEALILARSALNNSFWICYLLGDDKNCNRLKEYRIQPLLAQRSDLRKLLKLMDRPMLLRLKEYDIEGSLFTKEDVKERIIQVEKDISAEGFNPKERLKSVMEIAKKSHPRGLEWYSIYYSQASRFEHSDKTSLDCYRIKAIDEVPKDRLFKLDINRSNRYIIYMTYQILINSYVETFMFFMSFIIYKEPDIMKMFNQDVVSYLLECIGDG